MNEQDLFRLCLSRCGRIDERDRLEEEWLILKKTNTLSVLLRFVRLIPFLKGPWFVRGSAGCSIIIYLLGGSLFHPIDYELSLERFANIHRKTLGDIDIDVSASLRESIFQSISMEFPGKAGRISSKIYFREKSARRHYHSLILHREWRDDDEEKARSLEGQFRHYSLHVGGLCFWDNVIPKTYLLKYTPGQSLPQLSLDKHDIQDKKLFKIDILNNHAIDFLRAVDPSFDWSAFRVCDDKKVWNLIQQGDTMGVLYGESPMMKRCMKTIRPSSLLELALCFSLIRPMNRRVRHRLEKDPSYADYVKTMNEPYFDDDWIRWLAKTRRLNMADALRRRMAKDPMETKIKGYGFCRSHALHYAILIYTQAYYKAYHPLLFYCALLNQNKGQRMYDKWVYVIDAFHHQVYLSDVPLSKRKKTRLIVSKSKNTLVPEGGVQRRLFPLLIKQQLAQTGLFSTNPSTCLSMFDGRVACTRPLTPDISASHVYDSSQKIFADILL